MSAPTGPEPEERAPNSAWVIDVLNQRDTFAAEVASLAVQVSALQADVARLEGERDEARAEVGHWKSRWEAACTRLDEEGAQTVSLLVDKRRLVAERDEAREQRDRAVRAWVAWIPAAPDVTVAVSTQDAPSSLPLTPQSDAEGSGVAQEVREAVGAQKGAQGAEKCRCGHDGEHHTWRGSGCELCFGCDSFERTDRA